MRLFVAIEIPEEIRKEIISFYPLFKQYFDGNFVSFDKLHVTLVFIGNKISDVEFIKEKIANYSGRLVLDGLDFFFDGQYPRIAFINTTGAENIAAELYKALNILPDHDIHLHLTVCRIKRVYKDIELLKAKFNYRREILFDHLTLFNSDFKHYYRL